MLTAAFPAGRALFAASLGLLAGSALQVQQPVLWAAPRYLVIALIGLAVAARAARVLARGRRPGVAVAGIATGAALVAFAITGVRAGARLDDGLASSLEGRDIAVVGVIADLPQRHPDAWRFRFEVESARMDGAPVAVPSRLALGWYAARGGHGALPELRAGQRWQLVLRLKRPHAAQNPHGFDGELQLFEQGVRATGSVRTSRGSANRLMDERAGHALSRLRQAVRASI
ncbi:MAG: ComEC/Rec2 family competence protein, partial [Burkholderiaceae bacterium]